MVLSDLDNAGYNSYYKVLNAKNYGIPQNRERVFIVSIRKDLDNGKFRFPEPFDNGLRLKDLLEDEVDEKFYISDEKVEKFVTNLKNKNSLLYDSCQIKREGKSREYSDYASTLTSRDYKDPRLVNENAVKQVGNIVNTGNWDNPQRGRIYSSEGCSPALNCCGGGGLEPKIITGLVRNQGEEFTKETNCANTLLARDYKGFGNQEMNCVIENNVKEIGYIKKSEDGKKHQSNTVYDSDYIARSLCACDYKSPMMVNIKQATKQGYIECEVGGVADLSYPDSKTRRGRVQDNGNTCPTITATETGICRIEPKERFFNKTDLGSFEDYILVIFECLDCMDTISKRGIKDEERYKKYRKILHVLWEEIRKETVQWETGGLWSISKEKVLRPRMHVKIQTDATKFRCDMEDCTPNSTETKRKNTEKNEVRDMWKDWEIRCSSYKLELERQFIEEFTSFMSELSYQNTQNKKCMLDMWRTDERVRILQQALFEIQELRMSVDEKEKSKMSYLQKDNRKSNGMYGIRIRKLTPRETFRLMGFSDENFDAAQKAGISNSQLYKQAGNSIVVDVLYYIYRELYIAMPYLFDDLKLSSFFSGIGAFERGLDRLYKDVNSGNFTNPQTE